MVSPMLSLPNFFIFFTKPLQKNKTKQIKKTGTAMVSPGASRDLPHELAILVLEE